VRKPLRVIDAAISASWAMEEAALQGLLEIASREHEVSHEALEAYRAKELANAERATSREGVAILAVEGPLFKKANLMTDFCGATSYETLRRDLQTALDNSSVHSILLNVDSPGGEAAGVGELSRAIFEARGRKPIVAYAGDLAASAAYWIASAADSLVIGAGSGLGSIGVRAAFTDTSARDERSGIKRVEFISSQSPFKGADLASDEGRARIQSRVDALAQVFVEAVAQNRGVTVAQVLEGFGKGDVLIGKAAVEAGMADDIGTFEGVLASLVEARGSSAALPRSFHMGAATSRLQEITMTEEQKAAAEAAEREAAERAEAEAKAQAEAEAKAKAEAEEAARAAAEANDPVKVERKRVTDIMALTLPGYEGARDEAIQSGSSANDFAAKIVTAEKAKATKRAADIESDAEANAVVKPSKQEPAAGADAAVNLILAAGRAARGES
jgi:signal peptide peptidase SppA